MSKRKPPKHEFDNAIIRVIKSNTYQSFSVKLAEDIGLQKACIVANINDSADQSFMGLRHHFSYIPFETLHVLINELIESGYLIKEETNG